MEPKFNKNSFMMTARIRAVAAMLAIVLSTFVSCASKGDSKTPDATAPKNGVVAGETNAVIYLNKAMFKEKVFDYEVNSEWNYVGDKPAIIDFYADWCKPCKMLSPVLEEIQKDYKGKIQVYKIDTEVERELAAVFGIQSLPTVLFVPVTGQPQAVMGFRPKEDLKKIITDVLKISE
jgi:thioredoxin